MLELNRWVIAAAIAALILGAILSRVIEPSVRVEKIMLTGNTPAIRLFPATPGPHPIALLAHGGGGSATLWCDGKVLNTPSEGRERPTVNALVVVQTSDIGTQR